MKNLLRKTITLFTMLTVLIGTLFAGSITSKAEGGNDKRACWISFLDIEVFLKNKTEAEFTAEVNKMYDNIISNNMNTVIVHVRAMGDAIYPSSYYGWSYYITDNQEGPGYDPLAIMIELAHKKDLFFEAWINPYRLSRDAESTARFKNTTYYSAYKDYTIEYNNLNNEAALVLDPSKEESKNLIINGVKEIVSGYDVDGIHFDDYFYVDGMAEEVPQETRMEYVNSLVSAVYSNIKAIKPDCEFGISPTGNLENARKQGVDIDTWLSEEGYVDYIMPQIYWSDVYNTDEGVVNMYQDRCNEWLLVNKNDTPMYVGLALYRAGESSSSDLGWSQKSSNLSEQYNLAYSLGYDGYAIFRYEWLEKSISVSELDNLNIFVAGIKDGYLTKYLKLNVKDDKKAAVGAASIGLE